MEKGPTTAVTAPNMSSDSKPVSPSGDAKLDLDVGSMSNADAADVDALNEAAQSLAHTRFEHELGFWQAARHYRSALLWAFFANLAVILCGFDGALIGSLVGLAPFNRNYGHLVNGAWSVPPHWLSAFNYASYVGSIPGALIGGSMYDKFGPRVCLAAFSLGSIASIFLQFFSEGSAVLFVGELFNGAVTGGYPVIANAYISEVTPLAARGVASAFLNLSYVIGQLVASGMLKGTSTIDSKWSYKIPFATQWILPLFVLSLVFFMPTSAYWLCKNGRYEDARRSLRRLTTGVDVDCQVANIKETIRLEKEVKSQISILECFHGTNLRRTLISCQVFNIQALCGNILFINYAVYFFEIAGLDAADAFSMNIGLTCLGFVGTVCSYILISYAGRRTIYLVGTAAIAAMVLLIGILGAVPSSAKQHSGTSWAMCSLMVITDLIYDLSVGPLCFTVMAEISSVKLRGITIALSNISVVVFSVVFAVAIPYALDVNGANWGGKLGFLFFGIGIFNTAWVYFCLPETKYRTFEELDIMFQNKVPTRQFKAYHIEGTHVAEEEVTA